MVNLEQLTGKKVKAITGYISYEFGDPVFQLGKIVLEDNSTIFCEGEHDMPYLVNGTFEFSEEKMEKLYEDDNV